MPSKQSILALFLLISVVAVSPFSFPKNNVHIANSRSINSTTRLYAVKERSTKKGEKKGEPEVSFLLEEFRTANGSQIDPYKILKLPRTATKMDIKQSYRKLSRKLHPDMVAQREILPGSCANLEEVREEWEKVKLSYEILTDKKMKQKYDRNSNVADPGAAIGRAAMSAVGWGLTSVWRMGQEAVKAGIAASTNENGDGI